MKINYLYNLYVLLYMIGKPKFLAEGAYGCVHRPSLRCKSTVNIDYKKKISKIMSSEDALKELKEYVLIDNADKKSEYYLGKPETCDFERNEINIPAVKECENRKTFLNESKNFKLLIMPDGGDNLEYFANKMSKAANNDKNKLIMKNFWMESKRLLYGIKAFTKHGLIHHDIKPQNIVYNQKANRSNFIDFGIMEEVEKSKREAKNSSYGFNIYHWNFTIEGEFLNNTRFDNFKKLTPKQRTEKFYDFSKRQIVHFNAFFSYIKKNTTEREAYLLEYSNFLLNDIDDYSFENFIDKSFNTFDLYGLGLTLLHVLKNSKHITNEKLYLKFDELFNLMISPNLKNRIGIDEAIEQYEEILSDSTVKNAISSQSALKMEKKIKAIIKSTKKQSVNIEKIAEMDPIPSKEKNKTFKIKIKVKKNKTPVTPKKICPDGKVLNSKTNRCNKVKIVKNKTSKKTPVKLAKVCPAGKVLNSKTNRCNKVKIVKNKTSKKMSIKATKNCPAGKVLNTKTNRCNKVKP